jgi:hypothetical protein
MILVSEGKFETYKHKYIKIYISSLQSIYAYTTDIFLSLSNLVYGIMKLAVKVVCLTESTEHQYFTCTSHF